MRFFFRRRTSEYRISANQDDWVAPEETLMDARSSYSDIEVPITPLVFRIMSALVIGAFCVVGASAFQLSIIEHKQFADLSLQNKTVNFSVAPPRGLIVDRNGKPLVTNIPNFDLLVVSRELPRIDDARSAQLARVAEILKLPAGEFESNVRGSAKKTAVFFAAVKLSKDQVLALKTLNPKGFYVITGTRRNYLDGHQFSGIIGYVGKVNKDDLSEDDYYLSSDGIGRMGIEASYETYLRGLHGRITFLKKDEGGIHREPEIGNTVVLNLDASLQKKLYGETFEVLRESGLQSAAAVIQNPKTGAVLALVSFPDFDNNIFTDEVSSDEYRRLFQSRARPLFNRAIGGLYNPGSTIKPFIGMAALEEKIFSPSDTITDCVQISVPNPFNPSNPYVFKNWRTDLGQFNLRRAIANSCNVYFYTAGGGHGDIQGLGAERIAGYLRKSFADSLLGIDIPGEENGFIPDPDWKERTKGEPWYLGDTYNISIGQGDLLVTPLWLNAYVSAIANGGTIFRPYLAQRIMNSAGAEVRKNEPQALGELPFGQDVIREMQQAMRETVLTGTARLLQGLPVPAAAKTGTAEVVKGSRINSLFTVFAPADNPEISMTVLIEGSAANEGYAIRVANSVLGWYFNRDKEAKE